MWVNLATFCLLLRLMNMFEKESLGQEEIVAGYKYLSKTGY